MRAATVRAKAAGFLLDENSTALIEAAAVLGESESFDGRDSVMMTVGSLAMRRDRQVQVDAISSANACPRPDAVWQLARIGATKQPLDGDLS